MLNLARERSQDFQLLLTRYVNERLLYRLGRSPVASRFVLKGAALFTLWTGGMLRPTRDVDLLEFGDPNEGNMLRTFASVLAQDVQDEGAVRRLSSHRDGPSHRPRAWPWALRDASQALARLAVPGLG